MNDNVTMGAEVKIIKDLPKKQIDYFEDRVVYNTAVLTREYTTGARAYPYLSGKLEMAESGSNITGSKKEYGLLAGVDYAKYVYNFKNVHWTNKSTKPQWYHTIFKSRSNTIIAGAVARSMKEIK